MIKQLIKAYKVLNHLDCGLFFSVSQEGIHDETGAIVIPYTPESTSLDYIKEGYRYSEKIWKNTP